MKRRMNIIMCALLAILLAIVWIVVRGQKPPYLAATVPAAPVVQIRVQSAPSEVQAPIAPLTPASTIEPAPVRTPPAAAVPVVAEKAGYTAVAGDTLSNVAAGLLGSDSKKNRDTVVAGNPALQADPDRVLTGKTYTLVAPETAPAVVQPQAVNVGPAPIEAPAAAAAVHSDSDRVLKYTAQPGDNVSVLAAGLLGADSKTNRDAIIGENKSLQRDPDHVVAGKAYKIPAGDAGLSAAPESAAAHQIPATTQPDADEVVHVGTGRSLRYTARAGDTVSKLAEALLGSDTQENRDAIINGNVSLKTDPDRVIAGQTYWIPAPAAPVKP